MNRGVALARPRPGERARRDLRVSRTLALARPRPGERARRDLRVIRTLALAVGFGLAFASCQTAPAQDRAIAVAERGWKAHELVLVAGEQATSCPAAGTAMQQALAEHRAELAAAVAIDQDRDQLRAATAYIEAHPEHFPDLDDRLDALRTRCARDPAVQAVLREMSAP